MSERERKREIKRNKYLHGESFVNMLNIHTELKAFLERSLSWQSVRLPPILTSRLVDYYTGY